jgi:phosphopantothenoylcysteine decarboxylase
LGLDELVEWINAHDSRLRIVAPESRQLACGDVGVGAMAAPETVAEVVQNMLNFFNIA